MGSLFGGGFGGGFGNMTGGVGSNTAGGGGTQRATQEETNRARASYMGGGRGETYGISQEAPSGAMGRDWMQDLRDDARERNAANRGGGGASQSGVIGAPVSESEKAALAQQRYETDMTFKNNEADRAFKTTRMNALMGYLNGLQGQLAVPGGQSGAGPQINTGPTFTNQDIQQQVNAARAKNDATSQGQIRGFANELAGQGFAASSPLAMAMRGQAQAANLAANTGAERDIRMGAKSENAEQLLKGQTAAESQYASRMDEDIRRRQPYFNTMNSLISAFAGI